MVAMLNNVSNIAPRTFIEDALGLAAIFVIILGGLFLPVLT